MKIRSMVLVLASLALAVSGVGLQTISFISL